jgi:hypothetical protein
MARKKFYIVMCKASSLILNTETRKLSGYVSGAGTEPVKFTCFHTSASFMFCSIHVHIYSPITTIYSVNNIKAS